MSRVQPVAEINVACTQALAAYLRVKVDPTHGLALAGINDDELGTMRYKHLVTGSSAGSSATVLSWTAEGTRKLIAAGAIPAGARFYQAAAGKCSATPAGRCLGIALSAASADGDEFEGTWIPSLSPAPVAPEAHTADDTLTAAESGTAHTNTGATGAVKLTLPPATPGLEFEFSVGAAFALQLDPDGTNTISLPSTGVPGTAGKYLAADAVGETVHVKCYKTGNWAVKGYTGTWTAEA